VEIIKTLFVFLRPVCLGPLVCGGGGGEPEQRETVLGALNCWRNCRGQGGALFLLVVRFWSGGGNKRRSGLWRTKSGQET